MVQEYVARFVVLLLLVVGIVVLTGVSEHYGCGDVRGATAGPIELLHGTHLFHGSHM